MIEKLYCKSIVSWRGCERFYVTHRIRGLKIFDFERKQTQLIFNLSSKLNWTLENLNLFVEIPLIQFPMVVIPATYAQSLASPATAQLTFEHQSKEYFHIPWGDTRTH